MRYGVLNFSVAPYERLARRWRTLEELGFDSAWIADDLAAPGYADLESWALLAALARETTRMRIGTLISTIRIRHPIGGGREAVRGDRRSTDREPARADEAKGMTNRFERLTLTRAPPGASSNGGAWHSAAPASPATCARGHGAMIN